MIKALQLQRFNQLIKGAFYMLYKGLLVYITCGY
jgi:hypothetical protein